MPTPPDLNSSDPDSHVRSTAPTKTSGNKRRLVILASFLAMLLGTGAYYKWSAIPSKLTTPKAPSRTRRRRNHRRRHSCRARRNPFTVPRLVHDRADSIQQKAHYECTTAQDRGDQPGH